MTLGEIAGLIAAVAFCVLVALVAVPLLKLGRVLDELRLAVRDVGRGTTPILEELRGTVAATNTELEKLALVTDDAAAVSGHAASVSRSAAEVSALVGTAVSAPLRPLAALGARIRRVVGPAGSAPRPVAASPIPPTPGADAAAPSSSNPTSTRERD